MRCLAASGFLQRVEELGCGFGFWILDLGMKKGFPEITGNPACGAKGTPAACWNSAIFSAFRNCGYLVGYLTGPFPTCPFGLPLRRMPTVRPARSLPHCSFYAGGGGTPALRRAFLRAAGHFAKRWPCPLFLFHVFFTFYFLIFHFSITLVGLCLIPTFLHVFERDTPMDLVI